MPKQLRINRPNIPQHIIQRENNKQICFYQKSDYAECLNKLRQTNRIFIKIRSTHSCHSINNKPCTFINHTKHSKFN